MRIVSYNILDGGEGRADPLAEVIEAQRPDLVALVEADFLPVVERIANRLGMDYVAAEGKGGKVSALLSRWTIVDSVNHGVIREGLTKSCLEATVRPPGERGDLVVGVIHLHAHATEDDERRREQEVREVLDVFADHRRGNRPHVLAGDFNANHPAQRLDPARLKPSSRAAWDANGGGIPRRAVQTLLNAGYTDTLHHARGADAETVGTFSTQFPGQRVDYVFTHGIDPSRIRSAWIEADRLAKYASDHFPVGAELDW